MALQDKIYAYFDRDPRLHVLFVFDNDVAQTFTSELEAIELRDGYRLVVFDGLSWLGVKYAIEHDWKDENIILVFNRLSPSDPGSVETFPLAGLLAANAEYRSEGYEQFMQHYGIPDTFATLIKNHVDEFDCEKFAKILRPYFSASEFTEDRVMRGLVSGYMGESKMLSWEEIILKLIIWDGFPDEYTKKAEAFYTSLSRNRDVQAIFNKIVSGYFDLTIQPVKPTNRWKEFAEAMKYNSIVQLLSANASDSYIRLKVSDSLRIERLNKLVETARLLSRQQRELFYKAYEKLSADIREESLLATYGVGADYYVVSPAMADAMVTAIANDYLSSDADKAIGLITSLRSKVEETSPVHKAFEYTLAVASFYEKLNRVGSVVLNSPDEYIDRYIGDLYLFDLYYRQSIQKYHAVDDSLGCFSALEASKHNLDREYARIANKINTEWVRCLKERGNGFAEITHALPQQDFFKSVYDSTVKQAIIICDAFRYEIAKELVERLAKDGKRYTSELSPGLAMLPTETKYCKSALLPHDSLEFMDLTLSVDHKILNDTPSREAHLTEKISEARVVDFDTVLNGSKESLRPIFTGLRLAVLFYDAVDHEGHGSNPRRVVNTCSEAVADLAKVIAKIHDHGNVAHIYLTSDHGFLYNDMVFEDKDKLDVDDEALEKKSRYYITQSEASVPGIVKFLLDNVSDMSANAFVAVPEGTNRIKVRGGDYNFAHGGASLQEVIIPVLHTYSPKVNRKVPTGVTLLGKNHSVVSSRLKVQLFQDEAVSESIKERTVRCAIYHGETVVSTEKTITLSSTNADNAAARIYDVDLTLLNTGSGLLQLRVYDVSDNLNPLIKATVTDNTLIERDEF